MITKVKMGQTNTYLIHTSNGYILVDAGTANKTNKVENALKNLGTGLGSIKLIIVTHAHYDHVGSLQDLKAKSGALVLSHEKEKELLEAGKTKFPAGTIFITKLLAKAGNSIMAGKFKPVQPDITFTDKYNLRDFGVDGEIIHTPGHTEGSISVVIQKENLICGDTFFNISVNSVYPTFANDEPQLLETWQKIDQWDFKNFYPGHGSVFYKDKFLKSLRRVCL